MNPKECRETEVRRSGQEAYVSPLAQPDPEPPECRAVVASSSRGLWECRHVAAGEDGSFRPSIPASAPRGSPPGSLQTFDADLVHARRPAIPLDRQEGLLHQPGGNPPGERVYLDFAHGEPFTLCNQGVRTAGFGGCFLAPRPGRVPGVPGKSAGGPIWGFSRGANCPHGLAGRSPSSVGFPFHRAGPASRYSGSAAALEEEAAKAAFSSPPRRHALSPAAYRRDLPTIGRRRASPVMVQDHFLQAAARITCMVRGRYPHVRPGGDSGSPTLPPGAVLGAPCRPKCRLPESPCLAPSTVPSPALPVARAGCLPSRNGEFEQGVLYGRGPAQVGFGVSLSSFHHLTLSSGGILSPEPLRLTAPLQGLGPPAPRTHGACATLGWGVERLRRKAFCSVRRLVSRPPPEMPPACPADVYVGGYIGRQAPRRNRCLPGGSVTFAAALAGIPEDLLHRA